MGLSVFAGEYLYAVNFTMCTLGAVAMVACLAIPALTVEDA